MDTKRSNLGFVYDVCCRDIGVLVKTRNPTREQKQVPGQNSASKLQPGYIGSQNGFYVIVRRLTQGVLRLSSGTPTLSSG
jgi:hypothetical protein